MSQEIETIDELTKTIDINELMTPEWRSKDDV